MPTAHSCDEGQLPTTPGVGSGVCWEGAPSTTTAWFLTLRLILPALDVGLGQLAGLVPLAPKVLEPPKPLT